MTLALLEAESSFCFSLLCTPGYPMNFWGSPFSAFHLEASVLGLQAFITMPSFTREIFVFRPHILSTLRQVSNPQNHPQSSECYFGSCKVWTQSKEKKIIKLGKVDLIRGVSSASLIFIFLLPPQETIVPICNIIGQFRVFLSCTKIEK